jgi:hypothetical protein
MLLTALIFQGRGDEAVSQGRLAAEICGAPAVEAGMCVVYGLLGRADEAQQCFARVLDSARTASLSPLSMAWAYMGVGDERVFEWLAKAIDARDPGVMYLSGLSIYDCIRGDPRFHALLSKMGLG